MAGVQIDGVNNKIDFDDDLDTSISANTDDTLVIEAGGNTMATITATTFTINDGTTITTADNTDTLSLISTDADANSGPNLRMYRNSSSPADADTIGVVEFEGRNDNSQDVIYSQMRTVVNDVSDGTEDGQIDIKIMNGGSLNMVASFKGPETVINDASIDHDFRVESNGNTHQLFVDGGNDRVHINGSTGTRELNVSGDNTRLLLYSTNNSTGAGQLQFGDADNEQIGRIMYEHDPNAMTLHTNATEALRISLSQVLSTGAEAAPDTTNGGLTLQINAEDLNILTFKSSDVAHGMTSSAETDTFAIFKKQSATKGGLQIRAFAEDNPNERINIDAQGDGDVTESTSTSTKGAICLISSNKSGTGQTSMNANGNILSLANYTNTRFLFEGNGEFHADASSNTFDAYEDAQLVRAYDLSHGRGVINSKFDKFVAYNHEKLADLRLVGREDDGTPNHFVNVTGMQRLHNGAIWQQYEKHQRLAEAVYEMAKETLGADKADAILKKHDIKLLN